MSKVILMSIDVLEDVNTNENGVNIVNVIQELLKNNKILAYSRASNRISSIKETFPVKENNNFRIIDRSTAKDFIEKHDKSNCIIIGRKNKDFEMAVNNKVLFLAPTWLDFMENKVDQYGIKINTFSQLTSFIETVNNQRTWYSKLVLPDETIILSLSEARSLPMFVNSQEEADVLKEFNSILKKGSRNYYEMFLYHFLSSVSNNNELFSDINYWGFFPSSTGNFVDNPMFKFKETVRYIMKGQPLRSQDYIKNPNLFIRNTATYKSHEIKDPSMRIDIGSTNHFKTIHLNPCYHGKLKDKNICIFDDYLTHGNSFECARNLLKKEKVNKIIFVTLGRFPKPYQLQNYELSGNVFDINYNYSLLNRLAIPQSSFEVDETAKSEVENLHRIFNL